MRKLDIDESRVLALYEEHETARAVAEIVGCSDQTVYRILEKHGVPRTHRYPAPNKSAMPTGCKTKRCNALIVMLRKHTDMTFSEIVQFTGYSSSSVASIVSRRCPETKVKRVRKSDVDLEQLVHEYRDLGMTTYELGEKYEVDHTTISRWMREQGVLIGKSGAAMRTPKERRCRGARVLKDKCRDRVIAKLADDGDTLELVEYGEKLTLRCKACGHEFTHAKSGYNHCFTCPECAAREIERQRAEKKYARQQQIEAAREWLVSTPRICKECGETFYSEYEGAAYCSDRCRKTTRNRKSAERKRRNGAGNNHRRRMRIKVTRETYDPSVTLESVYRKFGGRCCQCGRRTHRTRQYSPSQATLDHKIALANNGTHTWDNVQLLCSDCNSMKRDVGQMRLPLAV